MNQLFQSLFASLRSRFLKISTRLRLWTSRAYWNTVLIARVRKFFSNLLNVRPKNKNDYYSMFRWLVSKRLAYAIVIGLGVLAGVYVFSMTPAAVEEPSAMRTYRYNSLPLKFYEGRAQILAKDGHLAYRGMVRDGAAEGTGSLFLTDGALLYEGEFAGSRYNGSGKLYYPEGGLRYEGAFADNLYHGQGSAYRPNGVLEYQGGFSQGLRSGAGTLYDEAGSPLYQGSFQQDCLLYSELLGRTTTEVSGMYTGPVSIYSTASEYCVELEGIDALYAARDGVRSLDAEWTIGTVYVLENSFPIEGRRVSTISALNAALGEPEYAGTTEATLPEAAAANLLWERGRTDLGQVTMRASSSFDKVYDILSYDKSAAFYIYTYRKDGLIYTFYCPDNRSGFSMYSIAME